MTRPNSAARRGGPAHPGRTTASLVLAVALLAGCGGSPDLTSPSSTTSASPGAQPSADGTASGPAEDAGTSASGTETSTTRAALVVHTDVSSGSVVLDHEGTVEAGTVTSAPDADTGAVLTLTLTAPETSVSLDVPDGSGAAARGEPDRSASVASADGGLVLGVAPAEATAPDGTRPQVRWLAADDGGPRLDLDLGAVDPAAFPLVVTTHLGTSVVASTSWGEREGGRSIAVTPTDWGRVSGVTGSAYAWADLLAADPTADTPGMEEQLQCHLLGAREKATWNLEPWRPDVSLVEYALARCNPT